MAGTFQDWDDLGKEIAALKSAGGRAIAMTASPGCWTSISVEARDGDVSELEIDHFQRKMELLIERAYRLEDSPGVTAHPISNRVQDCASSAETWWLEQLYRPYLLENPKARPWFEDVIGASARLCEIRALEAKLVDPWQKKILQFSQAKFRRVLEGSGMKQEAFAEAAGVPLETMKSWLKSKKPKKPALETIIEIARRLKISPDEMLEHA